MMVMMRAWPALLLLLGAEAASVGEVLHVDITEGSASRLPVAVAEMTSGTFPGVAEGHDAGLALSGVIRADLSGTDLYRLVTAETIIGADEHIILAPFRKAGAQNLVIGQVQGMRDGLLDYVCSFYDVYSERLEFSRRIRVMPGQWRRAAHKCADMVFTRTTGDPGHFDTHILYVAETGPKVGRGRSLAVMDYDGVDPTPVAQSEELFAMPRFSPDGRQAIYMSHVGSRSRLMLRDLGSGQSRLLSLPPGVPVAPRFSPDGRSLAFSLGQGGETDIYRLDIATGAILRLTDSAGVDTSPCWSPDGSRIVFESTRSGRQQIYMMAADGSDQRRISFGEGASASPAWSPRGGYIAFTHIGADGLRIGVMKEDGSRSRLVSNGPLDDSPSWAPSGRALSFERGHPGDGPSEIWMINREGTGARRIASVDGVAPDWSGVRP